MREFPSNLVWGNMKFSKADWQLIKKCILTRKTILETGRDSRDSEEIQELEKMIAVVDVEIKYGN